MSELPPQPETLPTDVPATEPADVPDVVAPAHDPGMSQLPEEFEAELRSYMRTMERDAAGELNEYVGEFVITDGDEVIAQNWHLAEA